ncbi:hypothetical protein NDU88_003166 [Pleurodeles waltl]|uniref:Uncharacterized protein n=1 Tax=Pleurodeles waltl TaxID=8319 RepID=A0AAV7MQV0_PLEWA|nr:hypothetical protein NDU88_003166 [Pleurodeles waltl]
MLDGSAPEGPTLHRCLDALRRAVRCSERSAATAEDGGTAEVRSCPPGAGPRVTRAVRGCEEAPARPAGGAVARCAGGLPELESSRRAADTSGTTWVWPRPWGRPSTDLCAPVRAWAHVVRR